MERIGWPLLVAALVAAPWWGDAEAQQPALEILKELKLSGYVEAAYLYNIENPTSRLNEFRIFDDRSNSFTFHMAELSLTRSADGWLAVAALTLGMGILLAWIRSLLVPRESRSRRPALEQVTARAVTSTSPASHGGRTSCSIFARRAGRIG